MAKKKTKESSSVTDFKKVKSLVEKDKLDEVLSKIDPNDINGTIRRVPKEVIRFMSHVLVNVKDVDTKVKTLKADQRIPIESLLESARKHRGKEFAEAFIKKAAQDEEIRRNFGLSFTAVKDPLEAKIDNTVNRVITASELMLKSKRLYTEISFMQNDDLLFRVNAEIDESLLMVDRIIDGVKCTFDSLQKNAKGVKPTLDVELCLKYLDSIDADSKYVRKALDEFAKSSRKTKSRKSKKPRGGRIHKETSKL